MGTIEIISMTEDSEPIGEIQQAQGSILRAIAANELACLHVMLYPDGTASISLTRDGRRVFEERL